jgi:hypothetical protein
MVNASKESVALLEAEAKANPIKPDVLKDQMINFARSNQYRQRLFEETVDYIMKTEKPDEIRVAKPSMVAKIEGYMGSGDDMAPYEMLNQRFGPGAEDLSYGDEVGYTNDYRYQQDPGKSYDNRWMHRPVIDWEKVNRKKVEGTVEQQIFEGTKRLLQIRKAHALFSDLSNISWMSPHNIHVAGFIRRKGNERMYCLFNFSDRAAYLTWYAFREQGEGAATLFDHWTQSEVTIGSDQEYLILEPYGFRILEPKS